jgi:hypothetical protein
VSELVISGIKDSSKDNNKVMVIDDEGTVSTLVASELPSPSFSGDLSLSSLKLSIETATTEGSVLMAMRMSDGQIGPSEVDSASFIPAIQADAIDSKELIVRDSLRLQGVRFVKPEIGKTALLTIGSDGEIASSPDMTAGGKDEHGLLSVDSLSTQSFASDINGNNHILSDIQLDYSNIENSNLVLRPAVAHAEASRDDEDSTVGHLALRRQSVSPVLCNVEGSTVCFIEHQKADNVGHII